jgi:hydrogenase small subunit
MPKVIVHNPVLAYEVGAEFMQAWYDAEAGKARPVRARSSRARSRTRRSTGDGYWSGMGERPGHRPADHHQRVGRPARPEGGGGRRARNLRDLRRHPGDEEQPDRRDGRARLPRLELEVERRPAGRQHPRLPGAARQHDRALLYLALHLAGRAPVPTGRAPAADVAVRAHGRECCNRGGFSEQGESPPSTAQITAAW